MSYADAITSINRRRAELGWNMGQLARAARVAHGSVVNFLAGRWPENDYRDWLRQQIEAALAVEEGRRQAA